MIKVISNFLSSPDRVRESALQSGFGTWRPRKGDTGLDSYSGVNFVGDHATPLSALTGYFGPIIPGLMFFRLTNPKGELAPVHADRDYGCSHTAILYLTPKLPVQSGTEFYQHRETGRRRMPPLEAFKQDPQFARMHQQMLDGKEEDWQGYEFVPGHYNHCVVFDSMLIHCRIPRDGFGETDEDSRMTWTAHFNLVQL